MWLQLVNEYEVSIGGGGEEVRGCLFVSVGEVVVYTCAVKNEMTILTIVGAKRYVVTHNVQPYIFAIQNGSCTSKVTSTSPLARYRRMVSKMR